MSGKFIYVFNKESRDKMISLGFTLIQINYVISKKEQEQYVFEMKSDFQFSDVSGIDFAISDTLYF